MPAIDIDRDTAHQAAQRELDKPIYPDGALSQRIREWLHELLYRILEKGSALPGGWLTITVLAALLIAATVLAVRVARRTIRTGHSGDHQLFDVTALTADQHRAIARHCAAEQNWTAAIRHRLRAVARHLEENGTLNPAPGRTANELASDAAELLPALADEFLRSASTFNDVTYGERPGTAATYQVIVELDDQLQFHCAATNVQPSRAVLPDSWTSIR